MPDFGIWSEMKFDASFAQFVLWQLQARKTVGRLLWVLDSPSGGRSDQPLDTSGRSKANGLPSRKDYLSPIPYQKNEASIFQTRSPEMAEVDHAAAAGAEEKRAVQSALVIFQRSSNENLVRGETDEGPIPSRLQGRNVTDAHDTTFDIVG